MTTTTNEQRTRAPVADWHREDIKAALRKRGISLAALCRKTDYSPTAFSKALTIQWPQLEAVIAEALEMKPWDIWPSRYTAKRRPRRFDARRLGQPS